MSIYRVHQDGIHGKVHLSNSNKINAYKQIIAFWHLIKRNHFKNKYREEINEVLFYSHKMIIDTLLFEGRFKLAITHNMLFMIKTYPMYWGMHFNIFIKIIKKRFK